MCEPFGPKGKRLLVIPRKFSEQGFTVLDVLPVFGIEFNGDHPAGWNVINGCITEFIDEITDSMVMTENNGRIESVVKCLDCFDQITITETVKGFADF